MINNKIIVIVGATCTNKTKLALEVAKIFHGEIINADAFQVYKELNVGVNKPKLEQMQQIKFHLINLISIKDKWNIKLFQDKCNEIINYLIGENKLPIVVGGSHLYINALINNYDLSINKERSEKYTDWSTNDLYEAFKQIDPIKAKSIINNKQRLVRAMQIYENIKHTHNNPSIPFKYEPIIVNCCLKRDELYKRINMRVDDMMNQNWNDEVKKLLLSYPNFLELNASKAIGYHEIANAIKNNTNIDIDKIKQRTRQYAKRQLTWIRQHYQNVIIYDQKNLKEVIDNIKTHLH